MDIKTILSSGLLATVISLLVTYLREQFTKDRRALGALYGMSAEIELSERYAVAYLDSVSDG